MLSSTQTLFSRFEMNFITNDRFMVLVYGLQNTLMVSLYAALLGIALGILLALLRLPESRKGLMRPVSLIADAYVDIIRGTPMVVQLMIWAYVIITSKGVPKVAVASIGFGMNSAAYVSEIMRAGIQSIDRGQTEAGRSLGLSQIATLRLIILPQAIKNILPALGNEFIVLIKETSIMGYIGLLDLAKAGDNIRGRTYDAFMPLFAVAIVYYIIVKCLTLLLGRLERRLRASDHH